MLPQPQTRAQAAAIFLGGCAVIAMTTADIVRVQRANEAPGAPPQSGDRSWRRCATHSCVQLRQLLALCPPLTRACTVTQEQQALLREMHSNLQQRKAGAHLPQALAVVAPQLPPRSRPLPGAACAAHQRQSEPCRCSAPAAQRGCSSGLLAGKGLMLEIRLPGARGAHPKHRRWPRRGAAAATMRIRDPVSARLPVLTGPQQRYS